MAVQKIGKGGLFSFIERVIFAAREKITRTIFRPQAPAPPSSTPETEKTVFEAAAKKTQLQEWLEAAKQAETADQTEKKPEIEAPAFKAMGAKPVVVFEKEERPAERLAPRKFGDYNYLLYKRQSILADIKDSLVSLVPFLPQRKKAEANEVLLNQALEGFVKQKPEFAKTPTYRLLRENISELSQNPQLPKIKNAEFVAPRDIESKVEATSGKVDVLRIEQNIPGLVSLVPEQITKFLPQAIPGITTTIRQGIGSVAKNLFTNIAVQAKGLGAGMFRLGGKLGFQALGFTARFISGLTVGVGLPAVVSAGTLVSVGVIVGVVILIVFFFLNSPFGVFVGGRGGAVIPPGNQYISIEKTTPFQTLKNEELPKTVSYVIKVKPKKGELAKVEIKDVATMSNKEGTKTLDQKTWSEEKISDEKTFEYSLTLAPEFTDSVVTNTVTVTALVSEQPERQTDSINQSIRIGNPPEECPSGWPTDWGQITQGADSGFTHRGYQAIDIGNKSGQRIAGQPIRASHKGRVSTNCGSSLYGNCVTVTTTCEGKLVTTLYAHMLSSSVRDGQEVTRGTELGKVGATGNVYGPDPNHLHYEFRNNILKIVPPYVPVFPSVGVSW